jgi:hypothetical protein
MKSKYFSNEFENKMRDFFFNAGYCSKPLSALVSKALHGARAVNNRSKNRL